MVGPENSHSSGARGSATKNGRESNAPSTAARTAIVVQVQISAGLSLHLYVGQVVVEVLQPAEEERGTLLPRKPRAEVPGGAGAVHTTHSARPPAGCYPCPPKACVMAPAQTQCQDPPPQQVHSRAQAEAHSLVLPVRVSRPPAVQAAGLGFWRIRVCPGLVKYMWNRVQLVDRRDEGQCCARRGSAQH